MGEGERGRQAEDPFEDLERFFEPIQRLEWPDETLVFDQDGMGDNPWADDVVRELGA